MPAPSSLAEFSQQLSLLEQHDDALRYLEAALRHGLSGDWASYVHGNYLRFLGRMDAAAAAYEASLARNPHYALAHQALATLAPPGDGAARVARIRASLARPAVSSAARSVCSRASVPWPSRASDRSSLRVR